MPNSLLSYCYAVGKNAEQAMRIFWEMPLSVLWQLVHCELASLGVEVRFASGQDDVMGIISSVKSDGVV